MIYTNILRVPQASELTLIRLIQRYCTPVILSAIEHPYRPVSASMSPKSDELLRVRVTSLLAHLQRNLIRGGDQNGLSSNNCLGM